MIPHRGKPGRVSEQFAGVFKEVRPQVLSRIHGEITRSHAQHWVILPGKFSIPKKGRSQSLRIPKAYEAHG